MSDWEQCVNSPVTLDKPAGRPATGTSGVFDRRLRIALNDKMVFLPLRQCHAFRRARTIAQASGGRRPPRHVSFELLVPLRRPAAPLARPRWEHNWISVWFSDADGEVHCKRRLSQVL